jgi:hypothetical protein
MGQLRVILLTEVQVVLILEEVEAAAHGLLMQAAPVALAS